MTKEGTVYGLGVVYNQVTDHDSSQSKQARFDITLSLAKDEYQQCIKAINELLRFKANIELFRICLWNYQDYYYTIDACFEELINRSTTIDSEELKLNINRQLLNILSSVKTYLDHTSHSISSRYGGKNSEEHTRFESYQHLEFDTNIAYVLLYSLRNYAQHRGLPINKIGFLAELNEENPKEVIFTFSVGSLRDELLNDGKISAKVKSELIKLPEYIEINPFLDSYITSIDRIAAKTADAEIPALLPSASYLEQMLQRISYRDGQPAIFQNPVNKNIEGNFKNFSIGVLHIPIELTRAIVENKLPQYTKRTQITILQNPMIRRRIIS